MSFTESIASVGQEPDELMCCRVDSCVLQAQQGMEVCENGGLLDDLVYAVIHSRAAYGYAMLAGSMSSVYSYFLLQTVINPFPFRSLHV